MMMQVSVIDTHTGEVLATEVFEALEEARNKTSYAISLDGSKVRSWSLSCLKVVNRSDVLYNVCQQVIDHLLHVYASPAYFQAYFCASHSLPSFAFAGPGVRDRAGKS
jgi:hypothetical protein